MTSIIDEIVPKLRRAIDDIDDFPNYTDEALSEYIEDAIDKISIFYNHGYVVDRDNHSTKPSVSPTEQILFVMQSKLDLLERQPNMSFKAGALSVTRKSDDKKELKEMVKQAINNMKAMKSLGINSTEFDRYKERFEDWLYIKLL